MNWSDLQIFEVAAASGSLSAGAKVIGISQPQMSRRLREFENVLGTRLFDRTPQGLRPTKAGKCLLPFVGDMRKAVNSIERIKPGIATDTTTLVRISVDEVRENFLTSNLSFLTSKLNDIQLEIFSGHEHPDHESRTTDVQIRSCLPANESLIAKRLGITSYGFYCAKALLNQYPIDVDISSLPWIDLSADNLWYPLQKKWLEAAITNPSKLRFNTMTAILNSAVKGGGVALLPHFMAREYSELQYIDNQMGNLSTVEYLVVHRDLLREPAVRETVNLISQLYHSKQEDLREPLCNGVSKQEN